MFRFVPALLALSFASCVQAQDIQSDLFSGQWVNDRNSAVVFEVNDGLLSGYYQTALGEPDKSKKFPLTGFVQEDQITFTVNFKGYGSLTFWTGQLTEDSDGDYIRTLWNLTRDVADVEENDEMWNSITSGASDFRRRDGNHD